MDHRPAREDRDVLVGADGITIGWKVFALLAATGMGFYVSSSVSPIETMAGRNSAKIELIESNSLEAKERLRQLELQIHDARRNISVLENEVANLRREYSKGAR